MAQRVGSKKGFFIYLTASLRAGTRALAEMCLQGHISTTNWYKLEAKPIDNHGNYSDASRSLIFLLENEQRVEVRVITWKRELGDVVDGDVGRKWLPIYVYVENNNRMEAYENHVDLKGYPWSRHPEFDKPLPGATWRSPTIEEMVAYATAIVNRDESGFLKIYYSDLIAWEPNECLGKDTGWVHAVLRKAV